MTHLELFLETFLLSRTFLHLCSRFICSLTINFCHVLEGANVKISKPNKTFFVCKLSGTVVTVCCFEFKLIFTLITQQ